MIRLRRRGVEAPPDWRVTVDAALPDPGEFWKKARAFERLAEQGKKRKLGFARYAPGVLPLDGQGKCEFPAVWRTHEGARQKIAGMSRGFCAYCQSPVSSNHPGKNKKKPPGQIEHFRPKSRFPAQAYSWGNYFLVCAGCNGHKHDKWPVGGYVRPDEGAPGKRFVFSEDGGVKGRAKDDQAKSSVRDFGLRRSWLSYHRRVAIEAHLGLVRKLLGRAGIQLADLLMRETAAFSEAVNQNVRRVWRESERKKKRGRR